MIGARRRIEAGFVGRWSAATMVALLTLSGCMDAEPTVTGEIRDDSVVLGRDSAPQSIWLELSNVGTEPCDLVVIRTELAPEALPVNEERVTLSVSGSPASDAYPMDAYVEIDGQAVSLDDPVQAGRQAVVEPGSTARMQLVLTALPEEERVIVCNGPGDYDAGRYAVLPFDR